MRALGTEALLIGPNDLLVLSYYAAAPGPRREELSARAAEGERQRSSGTAGAP